MDLSKKQYWNYPPVDNGLSRNSQLTYANSVGPSQTSLYGTPGNNGLIIS